MAAPLRFAAGIQNKILQAMAMEVPVVASSVAADGVRIPGVDLPIDVADGAHAVASAVAARLASVADDPAPHRAAREYVAEHFDWSASAAVLERALVDAVAGSGAPSPR
jgi:glycosyltransferase involved in cell wall biosynthesis